MPIIIPSKNIYEIVENKKVLKNSINKVSTKVMKPYNKRELRTQIFNDYLEYDKDLIKQESAYLGRYNYRTPSAGGVVGSTGHTFTAAITQSTVLGKEILPLEGVKISIPKKIDNGIIEKVYFGYDDNGYSNIAVDIVFDVIEEEVEAELVCEKGDWETSNGDTSLNGVAQLGEITAKKTTKTEDILNANSSFFERSYGQAFVKVENTIINSNDDAVSSNAGIEQIVSFDIDNISSKTKNTSPKLNLGNETYVFDGEINIAGGFEILTLSAEYYQPISVTSIAPPRTITIQGHRKTYNPKSIKVTEYGDMFKIPEPLIKEVGTKIKDLQNFLALLKPHMPYC